MTVKLGALVLDTDRSTTVAGLRSGNLWARTLLYRSGPFNFDVMVHRDSDGVQFVFGQITEGAHGMPVTDAKVRVGDAGEPATPDEFGQFALSMGGSLGGQNLVFEFSDLKLVCPLPMA